MAALTTGKIAEVLFEEALETFESQQMLLDKVDFWTPTAADMQNADNFIWRTVQQHRPILTGFDLTGQEQGIIQETYPAVLGTPNNDLINQAAQNLRDIQFWKQAGKASGMRQASKVNSQIASAIALQGSLYSRSNASSGFDFLSTCQTIQNERQAAKGQRYFILNDRDSQIYAKDLAGRQTLQGRPEQTWQTGQIGANVAEYDVYVGSFLPNLTGGASPNATVTGDQSFAPTAGSVSATGVVTNVDYRIANIPVSSSTGYNIGDKVRFQNPHNVDVQAVGLDDKTITNVPMTFTIVAKPDATTISVFPKPIALDDSALSDLEKAYANVDTTILNGALVTRLNTDATVKTNLFWERDSVEVMGGTVPAQLFKEFAGKKVINATMKNGQEMYMLYDGNIVAFNFTFRLFTWNGVTIKNPQNCGVATRYTAT